MQEGEALSASDPFPAWDTYGFDESCAHEHGTLTTMTGAESPGRAVVAATAPSGPVHTTHGPKRASP